MFYWPEKGFRYIKSHSLFFKNMLEKKCSIYKCRSITYVLYTFCFLCYRDMLVKKYTLLAAGRQRRKVITRRGPVIVVIREIIRST